MKLSCGATLAAASMCLLGLVVADNPTYAGYQATSDVTQRGNIVKDLVDMEALLADGDFAGAYDIYSAGRNSVKDDGSFRTLQGFSKEMSGDLYDLYRSYYGSSTYADDLTTAACKQTGDWSKVSDEAAAEGCVKLASFLNVWMYVYYEMTDAIKDCQTNSPTDNDGEVSAWDEAVSFLVGSPDPISDLSLYGLAEKRAVNFNTPSDHDEDDAPIPDSYVNGEVMFLFMQGKDVFNKANFGDGDCADLIEIRDEIMTKLAIPMIQGTLRYLYLADPAQKANTGLATDKERAELASFAAAILPLISSVDREVASQLEYNSDISRDVAVPDGFADVKRALESTYEKLGIDCEDIGGLVDDAGNVISGMEACGSGSSGSDKIPGWGVFLIIVAVAVGVLGLFMGMFFWRKSKKDRDMYMQYEMKYGNLNGNTSTQQPAPVSEQAMPAV